MSVDCEYIPSLKIGFGRTVTASQHWTEFQAIEEAFACLEEAIGNVEMTDETDYIHSTVTDTYYIDPADGLNHYLTVQGDTQLIIEKPGVGAPRMINLIIRDGGDGRFNFPSGTTWTSDANDDGMDGKPWSGDGGGEYGAVVMCFYDEIGWMHLVFARHDISPDEEARVVDIYNWR